MIATPLIRWLDSRFGQHTVLLTYVSGYTIAPILFGLASTLEKLFIWYFSQGLSEAPLNQAILATIYPKEKHGKILVFWMFGPIIGSLIAQLIGSFISEDYNWR